MNGFKTVNLSKWFDVKALVTFYHPFSGDNKITRLHANMQPGHTTTDSTLQPV